MKMKRNGDPLGSALARVLESNNWLDVYECLDELAKVRDYSALSRLIYNLGQLMATPPIDFRECFNFSLGYLGCRVLANEYEFLDVAERCSNRELLFEAEIVGVRETIPGFHLVIIRACDKYFNVINRNDYKVNLIVSVKDNKVYAETVETLPDPLEDSCRLYKLLVTAPYAGEYLMEIGINIKNKAEGPSAKFMLNNIYSLRLEGPPPPGPDYSIRRYDFRREALVLKSSLRPHDFGQVYPGSYNIDLPSEWYCREVHRDKIARQLVCNRLERGLSALILAPSHDNSSNGELSRREWNMILESLASYPYIEQPLGYSPSEKAVFFPVPTHGTLNIYIDRVFTVDDKTVASIMDRLKLALQVYHGLTGRMHQALYHWNIFIDSTGVRLGSPRYVLEELLATNLDPVDDSEALNGILEALRVKKRDSREEANVDEDGFADSYSALMAEYDSDTLAFLLLRGIERFMRDYAELVKRFPGLFHRRGRGDTADRESPGNPGTGSDNDN